MISVNKRGFGFWTVAIGIVMVTLVSSQESHALPSLKIQPLVYEEQLQKAEVKKGFIDISNPTGQTVSVTTSVEGFRQVNNEGQLEFFASKQLEKGITPDYEKFTLQPREALRMAFQIDGNKLPSGDVFGALFFTTKADDSGSTKQAVRVGTLFILENGTPDSRKAEVTGFDTPFLQLKSRIEGSYTIKNTAKKGQATGFTPLVDIKLQPFQKTYGHDASLVFANRERENQFRFDTQRAGLYKLSANYKESTASGWVLLLPVWSLVTIGVVILIGGAVFTRRRHRVKRLKSSK